MKAYLPLLLALSLSCIPLHAQDEEEGWPDAFSLHLKGTIDNKLPIDMQLQGQPGTEIFFNGERQFRGHYWYANKRTPIGLYGSETTFGIAKLDEQYFFEGGKGWETTGTFEGELRENGSFTGTWTDKDGKRKLPFKLERFQPEGAVKFKAHALQSSWSQRTAQGAAGLEHSVFLLQVVGDTPAARKINQALLKNACDCFADVEESTPDDPDKKEEEKKKPTEKPAAKVLTLDSVSEVIRTERDEDLIEENQKWNASLSAGVELNEHGILSVSHLFSAYTGGAHPNSSTAYFNFDTKTGAALDPKQLFKPGFFEALPKLATEKYRKQEGPPESKDDPGPTIESINFEEDASWFLSSAGFVVHYDPYAIASYARGNVDLTIPWVELESWLAPDSPLKKLLPVKKK